MFNDLTPKQARLLADFFEQGLTQLGPEESVSTPISTDDPELDEFFNEASIEIVYITLPRGMTRFEYADKLGEALDTLFKGMTENSPESYKEIVEQIVYGIKYNV